MKTPNPQQPKEQYKILFCGPVGSGKTAAVRAVSDIAVVGTDMRATDMVANKKSHTTVAMDYGMLHFDDNVKVHLYGTPGQDRFDFMWQLLSKGALGLVILIDNSEMNPLGDLEHYLRSFGDFLRHPDRAVVIGITHCDKPSRLTLEHYREWLSAKDLGIPVFEVDARERDHVKTLLLVLIALLDPATSRKRGQSAR